MSNKILTYNQMISLIREQQDTIREQAGQILILKSTVDEQRNTIRNYQSMTGLDPMSVDKGVQIAKDAIEEGGYQEG